MKQDEKMIFKYFYIKKFQWTDPLAVDQFSGQPVEGRVYRGWVKKRTAQPTLILDSDHHPGWQPLTLLAFENKREEFAWVGEVKEITKESILDFTIEETDLDNIIKWLSTNNKDLLTTTNNLPAEVVDKVADNYEVAMDIMGSIFATNGELFDSVIDTLNHVHTNDMKEMSLAALLNFQEEGKGINCKEAITAIEQYLSNTKKGDKVERIYEAIGALLKELQRKKLQNEGE